MAPPSPYGSNMMSGPNFDRFGRRAVDNEGDIISEENRLTRTIAKPVERKIDMVPNIQTRAGMG